MKLFVKHTKGPWKIATYDDEGDLAVTTKKSTIALLDQRCFDDGLIDAFENEANARLIAAAPELLAALIGLRDFCETLAADGGRSADLRETYKAIRKATGGAE